MRTERIRPPVDTVSERANSAGGDLDLKDLIAQLLARKKILVLLTLVGAIIGTGIGQLPPSQYRAAAVVQIEERAGGISLPSELIGEMFLGQEISSSLETEIHIIRSRTILDPVAERLRLDIQVTPQQAPVIGELLMRRSLPLIEDYLPVEYARRNERLVVSEIELPPGLQTSSLIVRVLDDGRISVTLPGADAVEGVVPGTLSLPGGGFITVTQLRAPTGRSYSITQRSLREASGSVRRGLSVVIRPRTGIVDFAFTGTSRDDVVSIVNGVTASYQEQNLRRRSAEIDQSISFIEAQLPEVQSALAVATDELRDFRRDRQIGELSRSTQDILGRLVQIETRLEELAFRREQALQRVTENHPDYRALVSEEQILRDRLMSLRDDLSDVPETERELANLTAQLERSRQLEIQLAGRIEQLRVLRASAVSNIRILEHAEVAPHIGPDRRRPIFLGAALGFLLAGLSVLALNFFRRGIDDARDIEATGLSLFATIEKVPQLVGTKPSDPRYGLAIDKPRDTATEAFRGLRTGLRFSLAAAGSKTLMITSCAPADGKSFVALNLALVSGQAGSRVLLIDGDLRRGFLRQYFRLTRNAPGLSDLLAGSEDLEKMLYRHQDSGIDFLPSGGYPPNPAELMAGPLLARFMNYADQTYDLVIIDAPPILAVTDPGIIGQHVGMSLMVVRHLVTTIDEVQSASKTLESAGVALSGIILNQFDQRSSRYGRYGTRHGYYTGGYKYKYD